MNQSMDSHRIQIIGHGIGGALLSWQCFKRNIPFSVVDEQRMSTSSKVSSGLINPVTGRYFAKSWRVDELMPIAEESYREIEDMVGLEFLKKTSICRQLYTIAQENEWNSRVGQDRFSDYISIWDEPSPLPIKEPGLSAGKISPVIQVNSQAILEALWTKWKNLGNAITERFNFEKLSQEKTGWKYGEEIYSEIVFADGFQVQKNPFFNWLPIEPTKGEVLKVTIDAPPAKAILKHHCFVIPWEGNQYWVGSNYEKFPESEEPDMSKQKELEDKLRRSIQAEYQIISRKSGIRPACRDRRAVIGEHPDLNGMYVLNGLGTKGTLLAPFLAKSLIEHILEGAALDAEIDVRRWYPLYRSE